MKDFDNKITLLWLICGFEYKAREIESSIGLNLEEQLVLINEMIDEGILDKDLVKVSRSRIRNTLKMIEVPKSAILNDHCKEIDDALNDFEIKRSNRKKEGK